MDIHISYVSSKEALHGSRGINAFIFPSHLFKQSVEGFPLP